MGDQLPPLLPGEGTCLCYLGGEGLGHILPAGFDAGGHMGGARPVASLEQQREQALLVEPVGGEGALQLPAHRECSGPGGLEGGRVSGGVGLLQQERGGPVQVEALRVERGRGPIERERGLQQRAGLEGAAGRCSAMPASAR